MSTPIEYEWKKDADAVGRRVARKIFELCGDKSEAHLSEPELASIVEAAINLYLNMNKIGGCQ